MNEEPDLPEGLIGFGQAIAYALRVAGVMDKEQAGRFVMAWKDVEHQNDMGGKKPKRPDNPFMGKRRWKRENK